MTKPPEKNIDDALDAVVDAVAAMREQKEPEFVFIYPLNGRQTRTQNASLEFSKQLTLNLLVSLGLEDSLDVIELYEAMVDSGDDIIAAPASKTIH